MNLKNSHSTWRKLVFPLIGVLALCLLIDRVQHADRLFAQPPDEGTLEETETPPADVGGDTTETASDGEKPTKNRKSFLDALLDAGIAWVLLFFGLSLVAVYFIVEHALSIRRDKLMPEYILTDLEEMIANNEVNEAVEYCVSPANQCLTTDVVLAGLERYQSSEFGFAEYKTAVEEEGENQTGRLYRRTEVLGVIGAIAPMLGLTGTVLGMITAFNVIAQSESTAKPAELAGGIGQALVTTLLGLLVAIPCMVAYSFFRNLIDSIVAEAGKRIERIMMPLGRQRNPGK